MCSDFILMLEHRLHGNRLIKRSLSGEFYYWYTITSWRPLLSKEYFKLTQFMYKNWVCLQFSMTPLKSSKLPVWILWHSSAKWYAKKCMNLAYFCHSRIFKDVIDAVVHWMGFHTEREAVQKIHSSSNHLIWSGSHVITGHGGLHWEWCLWEIAD